MPVQYEYRDPGYSLTAVERRAGHGAILCTSLLVGTKRGLEPVADILLGNLLQHRGVGGREEAEYPPHERGLPAPEASGTMAANS